MIYEQYYVVSGAVDNLPTPASGDATGYVQQADMDIVRLYLYDNNEILPTCIRPHCRDSVFATNVRLAFRTLVNPEHMDTSTRPTSKMTFVVFAVQSYTYCKSYK